MCCLVELCTVSGLMSEMGDTRRFVWAVVVEVPTPRTQEISSQGRPMPE